MKGKRAPLVAGAIGLVLALIMIMFLVLPKMHQVSAAKATLADAVAQQALLRSQLSTLEDAKNDQGKSQAIIDNVARQLPPTVDEPGLLLLLANAASRATLPLTQFTPGSPVLGSTGLSEIPVTFAVTGTYFSLAQFLFNLETLPRVAKVQSVTVTSSGEAGNASSAVPTLQMTGSVTLYTTDTNAGPGSQPGPTSSDGSVTVLPTLPPSPSTSASPTATSTPTSTPSSGA